MADMARKGRSGRAGTTIPEWQRDRVRKAKQRPFAVIDPDGLRIEGINLSQFCKERNLNRGAMGAVARGDLRYHKGYTRVPIPK